MTNRKATKRALLMSFLSILLCASMLIGTTYAWFTDSVTSAGNIIKSGTLDVEMYWADGTKAVPADDSADWKDASAGAIFNYDKWEPGYTEVRHIKIANEGTLALKYQLNIAANGEVSDLADVIDVYFADPAVQVADRTALTNEIGTLSDVLDGMPANMAGELEAGKSVTVTIALKMQEEAGNEYQDLAIGADFKVVLMATQNNVEFDSFDENYDDIEIPDKHIKEIDGNTYYYYTDGRVVLASVPYGNVGKTFTVRDDVTELGQGDVYDGAVPVFSKSSPIESITLPEGLVEIKARAITGVKTLTSINFPSTLKAIRTQALRQTGMEELNVPAGVEVIGDGAFRDMANLKTVTIEGNVAFENYAFRSCPKLETIYLLGDDVTFTGSQFATHSDNGDANGITIYVKNATVAARVIAAQTSAYGYEVKILGAAADGSDATEVAQAKNQNELKAALANGADVVYAEGVVVEGTSQLNTGATVIGATFKNENGIAVTQTISGTFKDCVFEGSEALRWCYSNAGDTVVFENCVIKTDFRGVHFDNMKGNVIFKNCEINGFNAIGGEGTVTFENCTFGNDKSYYNGLNMYSNINLIDCTFNYLSGKTNFIDMEGTGKTLTITNCKATLDGVETDIANFVGGSKLAQNTVVYN